MATSWSCLTSSSVMDRKGPIVYKTATRLPRQITRLFQQISICLYLLVPCKRTQYISAAQSQGLLPFTTSLQASLAMPENPAKAPKLPAKTNGPQTNDNRTSQTSPAQNGTVNRSNNWDFLRDPELEKGGDARRSKTKE